MHKYTLKTICYSYQLVWVQGRARLKLVILHYIEERIKGLKLHYIEERIKGLKLHYIEERIKGLKVSDPTLHRED